MLLALLFYKKLEDNRECINHYTIKQSYNAKRHSSGHMYFSLKDEESAIDVTMWSSTVMQKGLANAIQNGLLVTVKASVNFYNKMGRLNLIASDMQIGSKSPLQLEFDALKRELTVLGYFDDSHKQSLPYMAILQDLLLQEVLLLPMLIQR